MNKQTLKTLGTALVLSLAIQSVPVQAKSVDVNCTWLKNTATCDVGGWLEQVLGRFISLR